MGMISNWDNVEYLFQGTSVQIVFVGNTITENELWLPCNVITLGSDKYSTNFAAHFKGYNQSFNF
jgi:hypothetical protein